MKQIESFPLSRLTVPSHIEYHRSQLLELTDARFENPAIQRDLALYAREIDREEAVAYRMRGSTLTRSIREADRQRDLALQKLLVTIRVAAHSDDPALHEAGRKLAVIADPHRHDGRIHYTAQTERIGALLTNLNEPEPALWLEQLEATGIVAELAARNSRFFELYRIRIEEYASRPEAGIDTVTQRRVVDAIWRRIVEQVNGAALLNESGVETGFEPRALNRLIIRANSCSAQYRLVLANRGKTRYREPDADEMITAKSREVVDARHRMARAQVELDVWEARQKAEAEAAADQILADAAARRAEDEAPQTEHRAKLSRKAAVRAQERAQKRAQKRVQEREQERAQDATTAAGKRSPDESDGKEPRSE